MSPVLSLGRYALFGELASGGMATVHFARMSSLGGFNRTVAIKRMRSDIARDPEFVAMFLDEARLTSRIEHPNVVATLDVVAESGEVFLVMEYVRGESLQRLRRAARSRREKVPVPVAVSLMVGALAGLHAAHEALGEDGVPLGIVHRDVSPQNIMVGEDGISRITDFGIAKAESRLQVTHEGQMKGKLPYMAPEQLGGGRNKIDRRVDIFSAAVVLWELLAGKGLFRADHPGETIAKVLSAPIPALAPYRSDVTPALDRSLRRALSRNPDQRPPTAGEFALELEEAIERGPASPRVVGAWVTSLAGDVLANRMKYVREMESTSFSVRQMQLDPRASQSDATCGLSPRPIDREPDLKSDPSMPRSEVSSRFRVPPPPSRPGSALATPRPAVSKPRPKPPPPPPVKTPPPVKATAPPVKTPPPLNPPSAGPEGEVLNAPLAPPPGGADTVGATPPPTFQDLSSGTYLSEPVSVPHLLSTSQAPSIPPFRKNRWLPFMVAGALVGVAGLILVVALVGGAPDTNEIDVPVTNEVKPPPVEPVAAEPTATREGVAVAEEDAAVPPPEPSKDAGIESSPSETDTKGGSSSTSTARPVHTLPTSTGRRQPYLPDMP